MDRVGGVQAHILSRTCVVPFNSGIATFLFTEELPDGVEVRGSRKQPPEG
jgi:hypothetical protein